MMKRILLAVVMVGWLVTVARGATVSVGINNANGQIVNTNRPVKLTNNVVFYGPVQHSNTLNINSNLTFSGTGHAGLRLNNLTTGQRDSYTDLDGDFLYDTDLDRPVASVNGGFQSVAFLSDISGVVSNGNLSISTNDFVMNTRYTNGSAYAWVQQFFTLTRASSGTAQVGLYLDQNNDGTFEQTAMGEMAGAGLTSSDTEGLSAFLNTNAVYVFTNLTTGSSTAAIVPGSGQKVTGFGGVGPTTVGTGGGETNLLTLNSNLLFTYYALAASSQTTNFIVDFNIARKTNNATSAIHFQQSTNRTAGLWKSQMVQIWTGETNRGFSVNSNWKKVDGAGPITLLPSNTLVFVNLTSTTDAESGVRYWMSMEGTNSMNDADILARIAAAGGGGAPVTRLYTNNVFVGAETNLSILFGPGIIAASTNVSGTNFLSISGATSMAAEVLGSGTAYALTTSFARVDMGTTDPEITLPVAGTYLLMADIQFRAASGQATSFGIRFQNSTDAVSVGGTQYQIGASGADYITLNTSKLITVTASKTIQIWAVNLLSATGTVLSDGQVAIKYIRLY